MRLLGSLLLACAVLPGAALAEAPMQVRAEGPAVVGRTLQVVVQAPADGARLTFPDLEGEIGTSSCGLTRRTGSRTFSMPYRPSWAGTHVLTVSVTSGGCGGPQRVRWRPLVIEVAPADAAPADPAGGAAGCRGAGRVPVPRRVRAARMALVCLLNRERRAHGLAPLKSSPALRRAASRKAHRPRRRARAGEHVLVATGEHTAPARALGAWLEGDAHRADLLDPGVRSVGASVVAGARGPMRRLGATWVLELR